MFKNRGRIQFSAHAVSRRHARKKEEHTQTDRQILPTFPQLFYKHSRKRKSATAIENTREINADMLPDCLCEEWAEETQTSDYWE